MVVRVASRAALPVVLAVTIVAFLPFCHLLFRCGCRAPWAGAEAACNVHEASGPHCPWCEHWALGGAALLVMSGGQLLIFRARRRFGADLPRAAAASVAALPVLAALAGILTWLPTDYPHFLIPDARERLGLPPGPIRLHGTPWPGALHVLLCGPAVDRRGDARTNGNRRRRWHDDTIGIALD